MKVRRILVSGVILACIVGWVVRVWRGNSDELPTHRTLSGTEQPDGRDRAAEAIPRGLPQPLPYPSTITVLPIAEESLRLHRPEVLPEEDLAILQNAVTEYRRIFKEAPTGENAEIVAALTGRNERGAALLATNLPAMQYDGQLLDRWGTPYFFHALSANQMEIISAGPDRMLWTQDDLRDGSPAEDR